MGLTAVAKINLPYIASDLDRHGNVRHYVRIKGKPKVRLPGLPGSEEFMAVYKAAIAGRLPVKEKAGEPAKGSFQAVCGLYYRSADFKALDASTQAWRRRSLDGVCAEHGHKPIGMMQPRHVYALMDAKADTPAAANTLLKALKALFKWAVKHQRTTQNPTRDVERVKYKAKGHHSWTLEEIEQYEKRHPVGTKQRLAMALMLYTTGRREDAVRLGRKHMKADRLKFTQAKNEHRNPVEMDIPVHPDLAAIIKATALVGTDTFLVTDYGKPFTAAGFGNRFREWCDQAGLPHCSAHGLRKATAARLAECGATAHEIMAITGHQTLEEVERYTRAARRKKLADSAMAKL